MCVDTFIIEATCSLVGGLFDFLIADLVSFSLSEEPRFLDIQDRITSVASKIYLILSRGLDNHLQNIFL